MAVSARRERERTARREAILDAAAQLIADVGYQAMRMDELADAVELSKGTLYLYFANKDDLCAAVATRLLERYLPVLEQSVAEASSGLEAIRRLMNAYFDFTSKNPHHFRFAVAWLGAHHRMDQTSEAFQVYRTRVGRVIEHATTAIAQGQQDGSIRREVDPLPQALQLWTSMLGIVLVTIGKENISKRLPMPVNLDQLMPLHVDTMIRALASPEVA